MAEASAGEGTIGQGELVDGIHQAREALQKAHKAIGEGGLLVREQLFEGNG